MMSQSSVPPCSHSTEIYPDNMHDNTVPKEAPLHFSSEDNLDATKSNDRMISGARNATEKEH